MNRGRQRNNLKPLVWFTSALVLFLSLGVALSLSQQRSLLLEQMDVHANREFFLLRSVISQDLLKQDYARIRQYLPVFGRQHPEIYGITAAASNGVVLAEYKRQQSSASPFTLTHRIEQPDGAWVTIELTHDLDPLQERLALLTYRHILASILFAAAMALFLWIVLRKTAFLPLEETLRELGRANAGLEERVAARTTDWMRANTELKDALDRAEEEKNKSTAVLAAIADGVSIQDRDFNVLYQNIHHRELIGNHVGERCYQAYHRRDAVCPNCPVALTFGDEKVHTVEQTGITPAGPVRVEITTSPLRDSTGSVVAVIELVRNITERKQAEEDVRRAYETQYIINALLRIPLEGRPIESVLLKALDIVLSSTWYVSLSKGAIFLREKGESMTMKVQRGLGPDAQEACATVEPGSCLCGLALQTGAIQFSEQVDERHSTRFAEMPPHGHYCVPMGSMERPLGVLMLCLEDGHGHDVYEQEFLAAVANALAGIIDRKRMEEERELIIRDLRTALDTVSASRLEWLMTFDSITDMISIHDDQFRIIKANKAFARRFGLAPQEVIHKKCYELFHDGHAPIMDCPHQKSLGRNGPVTEEVADPKTGRMFLVSTFPFQSAESGKRGVVHIARDITEAKENETRLVMNERLAALGKMASGIAHEINNPLAAIAGCVDGMNRRITRGEIDQELFRKYLAIMKEELIRTKNITTSMLSIVQTRDYERRPVNIHDTIAKCIDIIGYQGRLKGVAVVKKFTDGTPVLNGSEGELKQVLLIVLTNALDAMEDRGTLTVETVLHDGVLSVGVTDTGPGIPPENVTRMFDPFFTTKSERGGTGLGLSIASRIVAAHRGRIRVLSNPGKGATITIELPL